MKLKPNEKLLFIGDSITDSGRRDPDHAPFGCGYVNWFRNLLLVRHPELPVTILNRGIGGDTAEDLASRWVDDVLVERPDWLVVKIGINDVNRHITDPEKNALQAPDRHRAYLRDCLERSREALPQVKLVLVTPFFLSRDDSGNYRGRVRAALADYQENVRQLAGEFGATLIDSQTAFEAAMEHLPPSAFSHDMVHLNEVGVLLLAETVYTALSE